MDQLQKACWSYAPARSAVHTVRYPHRTPGYDDPGSPVPFVVFSRPRMGSQLTVTLLNYHARVRCNLEVFHGDKKWLNWTIAHRQAHRAEFMDLVLSNRPPQPQLRPLTKPDPLAVGFLAQPGHLNFAELAALALAPNIRKIVIDRSNSVDSYVSELKALQTGNWSNVESSAVKVTVQPANMLAYLEKADASRRCLREARHLATKRDGGDAWLQVDYDELTGAKGARLLERMYMHIGVWPVRDPRTKLDARANANPDPDGDPRRRKVKTKQNHARRNESIVNYKELWDALTSQPRYQAMLAVRR